MRKKEVLLWAGYLITLLPMAVAVTLVATFNQRLLWWLIPLYICIVVITTHSFRFFLKREYEKGKVNELAI